MLIVASGCGSAAQPPTPTAAVPAAPQRIASENLPNAIRLTAKVISGGQPNGEAGFRELQEMGIKTIISVDGAKPDIALAKKHSLKYVHLPHGYDGIPENRIRDLAVAVHQLPGPIYIHCHHGKHRSPTAAAVACVANALLAQADAVEVLKLAGTGENYRGLFQTANSARRLSDKSLEGARIDFLETAELPPLADAMVAIEHIHDRLKSMSKNDWSWPADQSESDPPHEALLLREQFTELIRLQDSSGYREEFFQLLRQSEAAATELENALRAKVGTDSGGDDPFRTNQAFALVTRNCMECHRLFRDVPISEKRPKQ
jgi:protein tyrosine phosphatase (PTP) superfamily phosphohydrolase (DUF442 family)